MRRLTVVPSTALASLVVVLATLPGPAALAAGAVDPMAGAPEVGTCYDLSYQEGGADAIEEEPVACTAPHTSTITAVEQLPDGLPLDSSDPQTAAFIGRTCLAGSDQAIGDDHRLLALSAYTRINFFPTQDDQSAGARWISCGIAVFNARSLVRTSDPEPIALADPVPEEIALCMTKRGLVEPCARPHAYRAVAATVVKKKPTDARVRKTIETFCPRVVSTKKWFYRYLPLTSSSYAVACLDKTTS